MNSKDIFHSFTNWADHNRSQFFGVLIPFLIVAVFGMVGCSKTASLSDPSVKIDRKQFAIEAISLEGELEQETLTLHSSLEKHNAKIGSYNQRKQSGLNDLQRQDELRDKVLKVAGGAISQYASGGSVSGGALIMSAFNLAGIGWGVGNKLDNKRKDKVISENKQVT